MNEKSFKKLAKKYVLENYGTYVGCEKELGLSTNSIYRSVSGGRTIPDALAREMGYVCKKTITRTYEVE